MIQFDEHIFQMGWFNHQLGCNDPIYQRIKGIIPENPIFPSKHAISNDPNPCYSGLNPSIAGSKDF